MPTPSLDRIPETRFHLEGWVGNYVSSITEHWLRCVPSSNPAILDMFRDRERKPPRDLLPWSGEFAGKYLTGAVQVYRLNRDPALRRVIEDFVAELIPLQGESGYLGPWPEAERLSGHALNPDGKPFDTWDAWGHYFLMIGLLLWEETSGDPAALACARRVGDLIDRTFQTKRLVDTRSTEMNLAPIHALCLLHRRTGEDRYLRMAERIRDEFAALDGEGKPLAGDYLEGPMAGKEFFELPKPRWESLHPVMGLAELHRLTGDTRSRDAFERIWWSIVRGDRHNNGGFSSGEKACGNPYDGGAIETCCTIAWSVMSVEMLRLTGDSIVADELELALLNSVTGLHSPSGRWSTYNTPMDGVRKASTQDISFQAREGSPELNCCSVNAARGFGLISDWAVMRGDGGITLNWYGPGRITLPLATENQLTLEQQTNYPADNQVRLKVWLDQPARFPLRLRIPHWSRRTSVRINASQRSGVEAGQYLVLDRAWSSGDVVTLEFDFSLQFWAGDRECAGKASVYRGPLLLAYDRRLNPGGRDSPPAFEASQLTGDLGARTGKASGLVLLEVKTPEGETVRLCDFASAGQGGSPYWSWLEIAGVRPTEFSKQNPRRTG